MLASLIPPESMHHFGTTHVANNAFVSSRSVQKFLFISSFKASSYVSDLKREETIKNWSASVFIPIMNSVDSPSSPSILTLLGLLLSIMVRHLLQANSLVIIDKI